VNLEQGPGHGLRRLTWVDPSQYKDKSCYYHNFNTRLGGPPGQGLGHRSRGSTWVDLSQRMGKSDYHHSFKTWLRSWPEARFKSRVGRPSFFKKNNQNNLILTKKIQKKKSMGFWPIFYPGLTWVFYWIGSI
jgi:hypothetical protein